MIYAGLFLLALPFIALYIFAGVTLSFKTATILLATVFTLFASAVVGMQILIKAGVI